MHIAGHSYNVMSDAEVAIIHSSALCILEEMGMEVQNQHLLQALAEFGLTVDFQEQRARFPSQLVERFIGDAEKCDWDSVIPHVSASAGVYHSLYHDPVSGELVPWTEETLAFYFTLPRHLPHIGGAHMLGCRLSVPPALEPLYERYYCWKYGAEEGGSIYTDEMCPYLLELYRVWADGCELALEDVFEATVYLLPPLKLGRHEAYQVAYFRDRGLHVGIGSGMGAMGATAPVTVAGAVTLHLAEQLALCLLDQALFGEKRLHLGSSISVMDMRTAIRPFGRPELAIGNVLLAQMARFYGASYDGHAGLTDAKLPSPESAAQKALTAIPTLLAGGNLWVDAGLLAIDEVCSPIQMVLDDELLSALKHFTHKFELSQEAIGLETILETGPGGHYLDKPHTVRYYREEHWQPAIWSREMLRPWLEQGGHLDVDKARQFVLDVQQRELGPSVLSESLERELLQVIDDARRALVKS